MIRKYHNHTLQANPLHREEEPHNFYSNRTSVRQLKQSNQISLPVFKMIAKLEWTLNNAQQTESPQTMGKGAQWFSGRVLDSRPMGRGFEPHRRHYVVSLSKNINPSLVLVQPFITERLLMGRKESNKKNPRKVHQTKDKQ